MFIEENQPIFNIKIMCKVLGVSRAGFYAWKKRPESQYQREDNNFIILIKEMYWQGNLRRAVLMNDGRQISPIFQSKKVGF